MTYSPKLLTSFVLIIFCITSLSCSGPEIAKTYLTFGDYEKDVTKHKKLWGGYKYQQEYILLMDVFLYDGLLLVPLTDKRCLGLGDHGAPASVQQYEEYINKHGRWPNIIGIVSSGTKIKCVELREHGSMWWDSSYFLVLAEIMDGPYEGRMVEISDISKASDDDKMKEIHYLRPKKLKPDIRILRELEIDPIALK